jgi:insecticidal toxin
MPILNNLQEERGGGYGVQFINIENPAETKWISTSDTEIRAMLNYKPAQMRVMTSSTSDNLFVVSHTQ